MTIFDILPLETILSHYEYKQLELRKRQLLRKDDQTFRETSQFLVIEHLEGGGSNILMMANPERAYKIGKKFGFNSELLETYEGYSINVNGPVYLNIRFGGPGTVVMVCVRQQTEICSICNEKIGTFQRRLLLRSIRPSSVRVFSASPERDTVSFYYAEKIDPFVSQSHLDSKIKDLQKALEPGSEWRRQHTLPWVVDALTPCAHVKNELQSLES